MLPPNEDGAQSSGLEQPVPGRLRPTGGLLSAKVEASERESMNETRQYKERGDHETEKMSSILAVVRPFSPSFDQAQRTGEQQGLGCKL